ncbi:protein-L-isoaspartate carboxylmethyltransferase [Microbacterium sp. nov. GSS16]|uniref:protein-L-isoaspartate carboxylmethyltransferase n=1 Tax=Microbacterium sp. nov. GSS16 TaxID=3019890 RepID=UPI0023064969|nr:protein-L-isoaspartate carboxylmethyltransferase [Microbacterium sp. nov. GSS16]WCD93550.1 protein-L-isoaspartate carboxylmethyltransferase [Microbacterium sp. nov. GSS16]
MPYRDRTTVESWVDEYIESHSADSLGVAVLDKNFEAGPDSGIVVVTLRTASTITFLHPEIRRGSPIWIVTFEERNETLDLDDVALRQLAEDLTALTELRTFLQRKTDAVVLAH